MKLFSSRLANRGARLARLTETSPAPAGHARESTSQALAPGDSRGTPDAGDIPASGVRAFPDRFHLTLTPAVQATLLLAAKAADLRPGEFIARAIVAYAEEAIGFPRLADELTTVPAFRRVGETRFDDFRSGGGP